MRTPTFLLKPSAYKANKLYAILPDNGDGDGVPTGITAFGTRVNKDGYIEDRVADTPRIDYLDGVPGLLIEPTRTNQVTYSNTITGQFTIGSGCTVVDNDSISPDGTINAAKISDADDNNYGNINKTITVADATALHSVSFFVKFGNISSTEYQITGAASAQNAFITINDDGTTTILADGSNIITRVGSESYGHGWYRFYCTVDMADTDTTLNILVNCSGVDNDRSGYIWVYGFQLEEGDLRTSYIPRPAAINGIRGGETITFSNMVTNGILKDYGNGSIFMDFEYDQQIGALDVLHTYIGNSLIYVAVKFDDLLEYATISIRNTAGLYFEYTVTSKRVKLLVNLFGNDAEAWVNGSKVIDSVGDITLTADDFVLRNLSGAMKVYEMAIFDKVLSDNESQKITA